jgi:hypothetical protein
MQLHDNLDSLGNGRSQADLDWKWILMYEWMEILNGFKRME